MISRPFIPMPIPWQWPMLYFRLRTETLYALCQWKDGWIPRRSWCSLQFWKISPFGLSCIIWWNGVWQLQSKQRLQRDVISFLRSITSKGEEHPLQEKGLSLYVLLKCHSLEVENNRDLRAYPFLKITSIVTQASEYATGAHAIVLSKLLGIICLC